MTNLEGALREIREALELALSDSRAEGSMYPRTETDLEKALAKLDAILGAVPEGLDKALYVHPFHPKVYEVAELLHNITKEKNDELV